ncbi:IPT/TIG domain-containing protein [Actinoplanes sp. CA-015351]|uniref:IPT/TIG domain-containing protein n=1 Tax=Actinoplanes sp. CA-015351 TaxID=3239897 RepID=UPI003D965642
MIRRITRAVVASVVLTTTVLAGVSTPASAAAVAMTLSKTYGTSGAGGTLIGSVPPTAVAPFPAGSATPIVQFQFVGTATTGCSLKAQTRTAIAGPGVNTTAGVLTADTTKVKRITSWKIVFTVPTAAYPGDAFNTSGLVLTGTQSQARWYVCVYDTESTTTSTLLATSVYTITLRPTITSISPASSPAAGGQAITVNGTGFSPVTTPITASIGGAALTNIRVASNGNSFTATTGVRAADTGLALSVVAPGGTVSSLDPDNNPLTPTTYPFAYTNGITISPATGVTGALVTVSVTGAGFSGLIFDPAAVATSSDPHVFLVDGAYDPATNRGVAECTVGIVVSDTELICDLDLSATQLSPTTSAPTSGVVPDGAYIMTVVANGDPGAAGLAEPSIISSGAAFVVAPY